MNGARFHTRFSGLLWFFCLFPLGGESGFGQAPPVDLAASLRVVVVPSKTTIRFNQSFSVALRVENPTVTGQTIQIMSCSWDDHWRTSNTNLSWRKWECRKNVPVTVKLPAGGAYSNQLEMVLAWPVAPGALSFQMAFTPLNNPHPVWSEAVLLTVEQNDEVSVLSDPASTRGSLDAALAHLSHGNAPVVLKMPSPVQSSAQVLPELQRIGERPIVAMTEYKNWLWFATDVARDAQTGAVRVFIGGYAVHKGSRDVLKWGVW